MTDWPKTRLKYVTETNSSVLSEDTPSDFEFTYVDIGNVTQGAVDIASAPITFLDAPSRARRLAQPEDSVVSTVRTYLRAVATVPEADRPVVFSTGFAVLHPIDGVFPRYLSWYLQGDEFVARVEANSTGVSYPAITATQLVALDLRLPPVPVQQAIADFLDRETTRIDTLIEEQQRLIELMSERRQAVVTASFSAGPRMPYRTEARFPWLGRIPCGWETTQLKLAVACPITDGPHETPEFVDVGVPFLSAEGVSAGVVDLEKIRGHITASDDARFSRKYKPQRDDIFLVKSGATTGTVAIVDTDSDFNIWSPLAALRPKDDVHARYLYWFLIVLW